MFLYMGSMNVLGKSWYVFRSEVGDIYVCVCVCVDMYISAHVLCKDASNSQSEFVFNFL